MAEHAFTELGYFDVRTCSNLQAALDEESCLEFLVDWSNEAGNCTLVVRSGVDNHPDGSEVTEDELRDLFTHVALDKLANSLDESNVGKSLWASPVVKNLPAKQEPQEMWV